MQDPAVRERLPVSHLAALWVASFAVSSLLGSHGIAYWDAGDYVRLAIDGGPSGLLLGRPLFLAISRGVLSLGVDPVHAEPVLRWFWTAMSALAAPALSLLALRLGLSAASARIAGLLLVASPSFAHASYQVLTDGFALTLSVVALLLAVEKRAIASGLVLAAAVLTRETAAIHALAIVLLLRRQSFIAFAACVVAVGAAIFITSPPGLSAWFSNMSSSSSQYPLTAADVGVACVWLLAAGPVPVVLGIWTFFVKGSSPVRAQIDGARVRFVTLPAAIASLGLLFYPDGAFSPRYALAAAPIAFFIRASPVLVRHVRWLIVAAAVPLVVAFGAGREADRIAQRGAQLPARLQQLPHDTLVVPGHFCPHARLAATITRRTDLNFVCPGWEWPPDLAAVLDQAVAAGRPVAVDAAPEAWVGKREIPLQNDARRWLLSRPAQDIAGFSLVVR